MRAKTISTLAVLLGLVLAAGCTGSGGGSSTVADRHMQRGVECLQSRDFDCAVEELEAAVEKNATSESYNYLGMAYRWKYNETGQGEWRDKEIAAFEKAIEMDGENVVAIKNLAYTCYAIDDKTKAADLFDRALEINPYDPEKREMEKMIAEGRE